MALSTITTVTENPWVDVYQDWHEMLQLTDENPGSGVLVRLYFFERDGDSTELDPQ